LVTRHISSRPPDKLKLQRSATILQFVDEQNLTRRFFVSGRVQGVGFRMFVLREAHKLGISGFTRNLYDGRVEVLAHGTPAQLAELRVALQRGARFSRVDNVREEEARLEPQYGSRFVVEQDR
jgi:acylphosphatase